jgi:hypothetical protein
MFFQAKYIFKTQSNAVSNAKHAHTLASFPRKKTRLVSYKDPINPSK